MSSFQLLAHEVDGPRLALMLSSREVLVLSRMHTSAPADVDALLPDWDVSAWAASIANVQHRDRASLKTE